MSVFHNNVLAGAAGQSSGGAAAAAGPIKSLRFNPGDSAYLNRTFSSGNRRTFTYSYWIKEVGKGSSPYNNPHVLWSGTSVETRGGIVHRGTGSDANKLYIFNQVSNTTNMSVWSNSLHRDFSAWKHIVWSIDTTQATSTNRVKLYINGVQETLNFVTTPAQNLQLQINVNQEHRIGRGTPDDYGNFYLADIHFINGSALDATSFGAFDSNGVWQAAAYSGTYGTNDFHLLDFANESTIGHDSSGNNNDFTANNLSDVDGILESTSNFSGSGTNYGSISVLLDNDTTTGYGAQAGTVTYTPASAITVSSQIKFWYSTDQSNTRFRVNSGNWITLSDPNGVGNYTHSFSGSLTKIEWNAPSSSELISVHQIEIDSKPLISASVLAGNDVSFDAPTNGDQTDTGAGGEVSGNYCVFNPLSNRRLGVLSDGNLKTVFSSDSTRAEGTIAVNSGKFYWEAEAITNMQTHTIGGRIGICQTNKLSITSAENVEFDIDWHANSGVRLRRQGYSSVSLGTGTNYNDGDIIGVALDVDNSTVKFYKNGSLAYNIDFSSYLTAGSEFLTAHSWGYFTSTWVYNFGSKPFAHAAPSGYKTLCSTNLTTPTIADGRDYYDAKLWTGNSTDQRAITGYQFSPDLVYIKRRNATYGGIMMDTVRGLNSGHAGTLYTNATNSEDTGATSSIRSFNSDGFNLGTDGGINYNNSTYIGWAWDAGTSTDTNNTSGSITPSGVRANQSAGFSIVTYTGTGSNATVGHGLNAPVEFLITKDRSNANSWHIQHSATGGTKALFLNGTGAAVANGAYWNNTSPTSSVFSVGTADGMNGNGSDYVAYCWTPVAGYSAMGEYDGNGSTDGPFIHTGFRVAWLLLKCHTASELWMLHDSTRDPDNVVSKLLQPHTSDAEIDSTTNYGVDFLSNGFKFRSSSNRNNGSGKSYVYIAFAENPFQANGGLAR